ncbi:MAG: hypothetical protein GY715_15520 [Planctomycetes bacterium]|nr:hypothetical protein [Planctomycetota bacterium]
MACVRLLCIVALFLVAGCGRQETPTAVPDSFFDYPEHMAKKEGLSVDEWKARDSARWLLHSVRLCIKKHKVTRGSAPDFLTDEWASLCFQRVPENPLSPPGIGSRVLEVTDTRLTGVDVDPSDAGWVWNRTDEEMFAAGLDE